MRPTRPGITRSGKSHPGTWARNHTQADSDRARQVTVAYVRSGRFQRAVSKTLFQSRKVDQHAVIKESFAILAAAQIRGRLHMQLLALNIYTSPSSRRMPAHAAPRT
jgi:hypothetical protein